MHRGGAPGRRGRERGATAAEYVGIALLVGVVIAATVVVVSPGSVTPQIQRAWCAITGGGCGSSPTPNIDASLPECETTNTAYRGEVEGSAFSVNLGLDGTATLAQVRTADGDTKYTVSFAGGGKAGVHVMFGEKGEFGLGEGLSASAKAALTAQGGVTFEFDTKEQADRFVRETAKEVARRSAAAAAGPAGPLVAKGLEWVSGSSYDPPAPSSYYIELGQKGSADAGASVGLSAKVGVEASQALGVKVTPGKNEGDSPSYTYYFKGTGSLTGELGLGGNAKAETQVAITVKDGVATTARIEAAGTMKASLLGGGPVGGGIPLGPGRGTTKVGITPSMVDKGKLTLQMDLTNPDNLNAVADVLNATGIPVLPGAGTGTSPGAAQAMGRFIDRFAEAGPQGGATITAQKFEGEAGELGAGLWAGDLLAFGAGGKVTVTDLTATDAAYYDPAVGGMVLWRRCGG